MPRLPRTATSRAPPYSSEEKSERITASLKAGTACADSSGVSYEKSVPFFAWHEASGTLEPIVEPLIALHTDHCFTRVVADHMFLHYNDVLKIDGEVGNKKIYEAI